MKNQYLPFLVCSAVLVYNTPVYALTLDYAVEAGLIASDNINRASNDPATADPIKDEVMLLVGELNVLDDSSTNDFNLGMDVRYFDYNDDTFEDDTRANIDLASRWGIIDESLSWVVDGYYGQVAIDPFAVETPDNLQDVGVLKTGPDLLFKFTSVDNLTVGYKFTDYYAEITDADYQSNLYSLSFARRLSPLLTLSLNSTYDATNYEDNTTTQDFDDTRYFLSLAGVSVSTEYAIELGEINVEFDDNTEFDNASKKFTFKRQLNSRNAVDLELLETVDTGIRTIDRDAANAFITDDLFVLELAKMAYNYNRPDLQFGLIYFYADEDYLTDNNLDRIVRNSTFYLNYGTPVNLQVGFTYTYVDYDFYVTNQRDKDDIYNLRFEKRLAGNLSIVFAIENYNRETITLADTFNIDDTKYTLTLRYADKI